MDYKSMCIQQGYVPPTCQLDGQLCWLLMQEGKDPCKGCNYNRAKCNGRHAPYEKDSYKFGVFIDALLEVQRKRDRGQISAENRKIAERQHKHSICDAKIVLFIDAERTLRSQFEIELKVNDLIKERGYIKKCRNIAEVINWIPAIVSNYGVQQIQIDTNGYGKGIWDAVEALNLDIDIVPIIYQGMHLD